MLKDGYKWKNIEFTDSSPSTVREDEHSQAGAQSRFKLANVNGTVSSRELTDSISLTVRVPLPDVLTAVSVFV